MGLGLLVSLLKCDLAWWAQAMGQIVGNYNFRFSLNSFFWSLISLCAVVVWNLVNYDPTLLIGFLNTIESSSSSLPNGNAIPCYLSYHS